MVRRVGVQMRLQGPQADEVVIRVRVISGRDIKILSGQADAAGLGHVQVRADVDVAAAQSPRARHDRAGGDCRAAGKESRAGGAGLQRAAAGQRHRRVGAALSNIRDAGPDVAADHDRVGAGPDGHARAGVRNRAGHVDRVLERDVRDVSGRDRAGVVQREVLGAGDGARLDQVLNGAGVGR